MTKFIIPMMLMLMFAGCAGNQPSPSQLTVWGRSQGDASEKQLLTDIYQCNTETVNAAKRDVIFFGLGFGSEMLNEEYLIPCMTNLKGWYLIDKIPWPVETNMTESEYKKAGKPRIQ